MDENQSFFEKLQHALQGYWLEFIQIMPRIILAIILLTVIIFISRRLSNLLNNKLSKKAHDPLFSRLIAQLIKLVLIVCGIILAMQIVGLSGIAAGLLAGAGISAFIIGFAFKDIAENFLAGIILAFNRPFSLNDTIQIRDYFGRVKALNFRTTHLKTFDEKDVFLPNSIILQEVVTNLTRDGLIRMDFVIGIAYEDDISSAIEVVVAALKQNENIYKEKEPFAIVEELATNTVNLKVFFWATTDDYRRGVLEIKSNIMKVVKEALSDAGVSLPANIVEMKLYDKVKSLPLEMVPPIKQ